MGRQDDIVTLAALGSLLIGRGKSSEELSYWSALLMLIGQTLSTMADARDFDCARQDSEKK